MNGTDWAALSAAVVAIITSLSVGVVKVIKALRTPDESSIAVKALRLAENLQARVKEIEQDLEVCNEERIALQLQVSALRDQIDS